MYARAKTLESTIISETVGGGHDIICQEYRKMGTFRQEKIFTSSDVKKLSPKFFFVGGYL